MEVTQYQDVNQILEILLAGMKSVLEDKLLGLYLEGSLVVGNFDSGISDIDLTAALASDVTDNELEGLEKMHAALVAEHQEWYDRIEVCYVSVAALKTIRIYKGEVVNISSGEPIHRKAVTKEWIISWYLLREQSKILFGPSPKSIIEPISKEEYIASVKDHARGWSDWVMDGRNPYTQSYAILSICRALYSVRNGEQTSKKQAALWAEQQLPQWSETIQNALLWRYGGKYTAPDDTTHPKTVEFVNYVRSLILLD